MTERRPLGMDKGWFRGLYVAIGVLLVVMAGMFYCITVWPDLWFVYVGLILWQSVVISKCMHLLWMEKWRYRDHDSRV